MTAELLVDTRASVFLGEQQLGGIFISDLHLAFLSS